MLTLSHIEHLKDGVVLFQQRVSKFAYTTRNNIHLRHITIQMYNKLVSNIQTNRNQNRVDGLMLLQTHTAAMFVCLADTVQLLYGSVRSRAGRCASARTQRMVKCFLT